jgi:hypothetical protein
VGDLGGDLVTAILGLDVQTKRLGWAICDAEMGTAMACGCEPISFNCPGDDLRRLLSFEYMPGSLRDVIAVYVEAPYVGPNLQGSMRHAMMIGRALQQAERCWPDAAVEIIQSGDWKRLIGLPGNARKDQIAEWARACGFFHHMQDALDAGGIAVAGKIRNAEIVAAAR